MEEKPIKNKSLQTATIWAVGVFILANLVLTIINSGIWKNHESERGVMVQACDSAVAQYKQIQPAPDVVLMGSSLVMAPLWSADMMTFKNVPDVYHHHLSLLLQQEISKTHKMSVVSLALPGAMISDGFLLANKLFKGEHKPKLIVYGLAPRDFMDDLLTGETRTTVFQRLMTLSDLPKIGGLYFSSWQEKTDFVLNDLFYLYGKRCRYQDKLSDIFQGLINKFWGTKNAEALSNSEKQFLTDSNRGQVWSKSIAEYKKRYSHFSQAQFEKQSLFLQSLLQYAQKENIQICLLNMPLSQNNLQLIPQDLYKKYLKQVEQVASNNNCTFIDLQKDPFFTDTSTFYDTVHLNAKGGNKFISMVSQLINQRELPVVQLVERQSTH